MNVTIAPDGKLAVLPPGTKPGDLVRFRAEIDLVVGLTACSAYASNGGTFKPIDFAVMEPRQAARGLLVRTGLMILHRSLSARKEAELHRFMGAENAPVGADGGAPQNRGSLHTLPSGKHAGCWAIG